MRKAPTLETPSVFWFILDGSKLLATAKTPVESSQEEVGQALIDKGYPPNVTLCRALNTLLA